MLFYNHNIYRCLGGLLKLILSGDFLCYMALYGWAFMCTVAPQCGSCVILVLLYRMIQSCVEIVEHCNRLYSNI